MLLLRVIVLLCIQAATDLKLPSYTSNIVNVGIQQGGIENSETPGIKNHNKLQKLMEEL